MRDLCTNNFNQGTVSSCRVNNSLLSDCKDSGANTSLLAGPSGIVLNSAGIFAYIVNRFGNTVTACNVETGGVLSNCVNSGARELASPFGIALTPDGATAFITNFDNNMVSTCRVSGTTLSNCTYTGLY